MTTKNPSLYPLKWCLRNEILCSAAIFRYFKMLRSSEICRQSATEIKNEMLRYSEILRINETCQRDHYNHHAWVR